MQFKNPKKVQHGNALYPNQPINPTLFKILKP